MNQQPIWQARDEDLRFTVAAMSRAACRAREIAVQTGTKLVICLDGKVQTLEPGPIRSDAASAAYPERH
jgi:hypothetical protein